MGATSGRRGVCSSHSVVASLGQIRNAKYVAAPHYPCLCGPAPNQHLSCSVLGLVTSWRDLGLLGGHS